ncbi:MAG: DUF2905 domain-containing protein [Acidobacteria bacterium]|nr:MAG: DUF2905 domain-containing protein [Acidobacteriota bacterium]
MSHSQMGSLLIAAGVVLIVAGLLLRLGAFRWFGHLPGDIRIEGEHVFVYVPLASMLLLSVLLSALLWLLRKLF